MKIYLVKHIRLGNKDEHTYIWGIYSDRRFAEIDGAYSCKFWRGGKYEFEILEDWVTDTTKEIYITEFNMNQNYGKFDFRIYENAYHTITHSIGELLEFNCNKEVIQNDIAYLDNDEAKYNYEFLRDHCQSLMSHEAWLYLCEKLRYYDLDKYNKQS